MWLEAEDLVREALDDYDKGKTISIPSKRYKALTAAARYTPATIKVRLQKLGRR
jgi:hypothetical protein